MRGSSVRTSSSVAASRNRYPSRARSSQSRNRGLASRSVTGTARLELEQAPYRGDDALRRGHVRVLDLPVRIGNVVAGDAEHGSPEIQHRLLCEDRSALASNASSSSGFSERMSSTSTETSSSASAAASQTATIEPYATSETSSPSRARRALPSGTTCSPSGTSPFVVL